MTNLRTAFCHSLLLALSPLALCVGEEPAVDPDLLRFSNGDALHGSFLGMENATTVKWTGSSIKTPIALEAGDLRQIALNGGRPTKALGGPEYVGLVNGDQIPGRVVDLDGETVTIDTPLGDTLTVERKFVSSISPNPFGGTLHYMGPFNPEGWAVVEPQSEEGKPRVRRVPEEDQENAEDDADGDGNKDDNMMDDSKEKWVFGGDAWYSNSQTPIALEADLPDRARIAFRLAWKSRLSAVIAFHATLAPPEFEDEEGEDGEKKQRAVQRASSGTNNFPHLYGSSYVMTLYSSYAMLYRCSFDEDGNAVLNRLTHSSTSIRLDDTGSATFELRCDRKNATISLFANGEYINQWEDPEGYAGLGGHLAFSCQSSSARLRVSDVVISAWNGMADSARSMDSEDRDTILLNNGTDRFSGHIEGIEDGRYTLTGSYATMHIPIRDVEEIRLAGRSRAELPDPTGKALRIVLRPAGRLTVEALSSSATEMTARHEALGDLTFDLRYASLLEFSFDSSILDFWDDDF